MKDRTARILAIVALVFMGIFSVTLVLTLVDHRMLNNAIGFISLGSGVFGIVIMLALKADGRGYSITKMNNEIEMQKIEKALQEQAEREEHEKNSAENADSENAENDSAENAESVDAPSDEEK